MNTEPKLIPIETPVPVTWLDISWKAPVIEKLQTPNSKLQRNSKCQAPTKSLKSTRGFRCTQYSGSSLQHRAARILTLPRQFQKSVSGARTFLSAATYESSAGSGHFDDLLACHIAADKNVRAPRLQPSECNHVTFRRCNSGVRGRRG